MSGLKNMGQFANMMGMQNPGMSLAGQTLPTRLLSRSRPDAVFARTFLITLMLLLIMFLVYKLVTIVTTDEAKLLRGQLVILSLSILIGTILSWVGPTVLLTVYKPLEALVD